MAGSCVVYGPHCHHDECGWFVCDHTGLVDFPCRDQDSCPHCGLDSEQWTRVAQGMTEWLRSLYGTVEVDQLRVIDGIPDSALRYAQILRQATDRCRPAGSHPGGQLPGDGDRAAGRTYTARLADPSRAGHALDALDGVEVPPGGS